MIDKREALLLCPFCGSTAERGIFGSGKGHIVACSSDHCDGKIGMEMELSREQAATLWNTRASLEQKAEPVTCVLCGGTGYDPECDVQAVCCGNVDRHGECCSHPIQEQVALPCRQCDGFGRIYATPPSTAEVEARALDIDAIAQHIRKVDGRNTMGAGALAESISEFIAKRIREQSND